MSTVATWPSQAETWLDERGKGAWIAATVLGFIFFWPVGLALLFYSIFRKPSMRNASSRRDSHVAQRQTRHAAFKSSGNMAFDSYKRETLRRLEEEQENFEAFLERLRESKDKAEFDQFMEERARKSRSKAETDEANYADDNTSGY